MTQKLTPKEIDAALVPYKEWHKNGYESLSRLFEFKDFDETMAFVNKCADLAREQDHHPIMLIEYNKVSITTWTHDVEGVSERDVRFIEAVERF